MGGALVVLTVAGVFGVVVGRWWFVGVVVAGAAMHAGWIVVTGQEDEGSTGTALLLSVVYLYFPAVVGASLGAWAGRSIRRSGAGHERR